MHPDQPATPDSMGTLAPERATSVVSRRMLALAMGLLYVSALPDAMVVPVLRQLIVERYDVGAVAAHAFMCINVLGALAATGLIRRLRGHRRPGLVIALAAFFNGLLLMAMALPIGFLPTLAIRFVEGATDLTVYAFLFDLIARTGATSTKGRRMGASATCLMLGIASGLGLGGIVGRFDPVLSLWVGAAACLIVAPAALRLVVVKAGKPDTHLPAPAPIAPTSVKPLWPALLMMFSDRALAGVLITTVPLYMASIARLDSATIGGLIGISMLMTALGAWPAGRLADTIGVWRLRLLSGLVYALCFASIIVVTFSSTMLTGLVLTAFGLAGAALFASSLLLVCQSGSGPGGMAAYHTAGNLGFLLGPFFAGVVIATAGDLEPTVGVYSLILTSSAAMHLSITALTTFALAGRFRSAALDVEVTQDTNPEFSGSGV